MGVIDPRTAPPIGPGPEQDTILKAVGDEITNRGFVIAKADPAARSPTRRLARLSWQWHAWRRACATGEVLDLTS